MTYPKQYVNKRYMMTSFSAYKPKSSLYFRREQIDSNFFLIIKNLYNLRIYVRSSNIKCHFSF